MLDRQAVLSRPPELPRLSEPFYKFDRRHVPVLRLSQGNVARRSLAPWMLVLLSNPGALWQPAATTCGVSFHSNGCVCVDLLGACSAVSSRRAPRVCLASALRAYVRVAPARSARTIISVPLKARFCGLALRETCSPSLLSLMSLSRSGATNTACPRRCGLRRPPAAQPSRRSRGKDGRVDSPPPPSPR